MQKSQTQNSVKQAQMIQEQKPEVKLEQKPQKPSHQRPQLTQQPKKKKRVHLSFEEQIDQIQTPAVRISKNPTVNKNSSLVNSHRKSSNGQNIQQIIKAEYLQKIQKLKQQLIELEYSYWDGGEVVRKLRRKKKEKVRDILEVIRLELISSHQSLIHLTASDFLFVIKDFIVPAEMALYQIQALELKTKKNDLLLNLRNVKIKKDGKELTLSVIVDDQPVRIVQKAKYQKSKNSFPFNNWQTIKITGTNTLK